MATATAQVDTTTARDWYPFIHRDPLGVVVQLPGAPDPIRLEPRVVVEKVVHSRSDHDVVIMCIKSREDLGADYSGLLICDWNDETLTWRSDRRLTAEDLRKRLGKRSWIDEVYPFDALESVTLVVATHDATPTEMAPVLRTWEVWNLRTAEQVKVLSPDEIPAEYKTGTLWIAAQMTADPAKRASLEKLRRRVQDQDHPSQVAGEYLGAPGLNDILTRLARSQNLTVHNESRWIDVPLGFQMRATWSDEQVKTALLELLRLRGIEVTMDDSTMRVIDVSDPSPALAAAHAAKSLDQRLPRCTAAPSAGAAEPVSMSGAGLSVQDLLTLVQNLTGRTILKDDRLPGAEVTFSIKAPAPEALAQMDALLHQHGILLLEVDCDFIEAIAIPR